MPVRFHPLAAGLALAGLSAAAPPALTVLDYYHRLLPDALPVVQLNSKPAVVDLASGCLRFNSAPPDAWHYAEVAVWKLADGTPVIGANYETPGGGGGCDATLHFYTYTPCDAREMPAQSRQRPQSWHDITAKVFFTTPPTVSQAVTRRLHDAGITSVKAFGANDIAPWVVHLPQHGTSICLALTTCPVPGPDADDDDQAKYLVKPALRHKDVTLCYLRWQNDKFVASLEP